MVQLLTIPDRGIAVGPNTVEVAFGIAVGEIYPYTDIDTSTDDGVEMKSEGVFVPHTTKPVSLRPKTIEEKISARFHVNESENVSRFINRNSFLKDLILEAYNEITEQFGQLKPFLALIQVPENRDYDYLVISILTDLSAEEANEKLSKINNSWTYPHYPELDGKLSIYLEYI